MRGIPSIFEFADYREFLTSVFAAKQREGFGLTYFSKLLGFRSANYAGLVLSGKRNLTTANMLRTAKALQLTFNETEYLEALVQHNQSTSDDEARYFDRRLKSLKKTAPKSSIRLSGAGPLSEWYFPAVLALVDRTPAGEAIPKIVANLSVTKSKATEIIDFLKREKSLSLDGENYRLNYSHQIFFDEKSMSVNHKKYLSSQLDLSKKAFRRSYENGAKFYSHTFSIEKADLPFYQDKMRSLLTECTARSDQTKPEGVAQLNIQLFPIDRGCF